MPWWGWVIIAFIITNMISNSMTARFYRKMRSSYKEMTSCIQKQLDEMSRTTKIISRALDEQLKVADKISLIDGVIRTLTSKKG